MSNIYRLELSLLPFCSLVSVYLYTWSQIRSFKHSLIIISSEGLISTLWALIDIRKLTPFAPKISLDPRESHHFLCHYQSRGFSLDQRQSTSSEPTSPNNSRSVYVMIFFYLKYQTKIMHNTFMNNGWWVNYYWWNLLSISILRIKSQYTH